MKATELKAGDWVLHTIHGEEAVDRIESIPNQKYAWLDWREGEMFAYTRDLSPIPLTEEILKENGWVKMTDCMVYNLNGGTLIADNFKMPYWSIEKAFNGDIVPLCKIQHVHQLQHLLWALGLDDNLKLPQ